MNFSQFMGFNYWGLVNRAEMLKRFYNDPVFSRDLRHEIRDCMKRLPPKWRARAFKIMLEKVCNP